MKKISYKLLFLAAFICSPVLGNEYKVLIPHGNDLGEPFGNVTPVHYVVNQSGELIYKKIGAAKDLIRRIGDFPVLEISPKEMKKIRRWKPADLEFEDVSFTIILVRTDNYEGCPRCKKHELRCRKVKEKLDNLNVAFVQYIKDYGENFSVEIVSDKTFDALVNGAKN